MVSVSVDVRDSFSILVRVSITSKVALSVNISSKTIISIRLIEVFHFMVSVEVAINLNVSGRISYEYYYLGFVERFCAAPYFAYHI